MDQKILTNAREKYAEIYEQIKKFVASETHRSYLAFLQNPTQEKREASHAELAQIITAVGRFYTHIIADYVFDAVPKSTDYAKLASEIDELVTRPAMADLLATFNKATTEVNEALKNINPEA